MECRKFTSAIIEGKRSPGRPRQTWMGYPWNTIPSSYCLRQVVLTKQSIVQLKKVSQFPTTTFHIPCQY